MPIIVDENTSAALMRMASQPLKPKTRLSPYPVEANTTALMSATSVD
ncbi:MAG: hypothetical protein CM15mP84_07570 [Cellvibrionales bacterium]|nr:MAG: hypothetical protein CM15mP84_07570 [Cellvibrionales bacterium]